jgi:hypothetical protein
LDKETLKKLTKDFPKSVVKKAPQGKFGDYVPHHIYTQRLVDVIPGKYNFKYEPLRDKDGALVGAKCILEIDGLGTMEEVGDVDSNALKRNITESEVLKLAVSDGIKRCCMRFGIGLELWTGGVTEEEHYAVQQPIQKTGTVKDQVIEKEDEALKKAKENFAKDVAQPPPPKITQEALQEMVFISCNEDKNFANKCWKTSMEMTKLKAKVTGDVATWKESTIKTFLDNVETFVTNYADEYKEREGNTDTINNIIDVLDAKVSDNKEEEVGEVKEGPWMQEQPSEKQMNTFNNCLTKAIDNGDDELAAKAKSALADGSINKGNIFDWVDTETWSLKDGS